MIGLKLTSKSSEEITIGLLINLIYKILKTKYFNK